MIPTVAEPLQRFAKLACGGNDFVIIDSRHSPPGGDLEALARAVCDRRAGIGADGLIILVADNRAPFGIMLFNEDGSRAEVSYNGSRCVGLYAIEEGIATAPLSFGSEAGPIEVDAEGRMITLRVPPPGRIELDLTIREEGENIEGALAVVGVPYFVLFRDDLHSAWVETVAPRLKTNSAFPDGANIAVARPPQGATTEARFFERGVAEETPSSGTGCVAVALSAALLYGAESPFTVRTAGGDFPVAFKRRKDHFSDIVSSGEVRFICRGELVN